MPAHDARDNMLWAEIFLFGLLCFWLVQRADQTGVRLGISLRGLAGLGDLVGLEEAVSEEEEREARGKRKRTEKEEVSGER